MFPDYPFLVTMVFVKTYEVFCLIPVFVLMIRYFIMYNVSLVLLDADLYISKEEAKWKF